MDTSPTVYGGASGNHQGPNSGTSWPRFVALGDDDDITGAGDKAAAKAEPKPTAQRNFTDLDARITKTADGSYKYCYTG